MSEGEPSKGPTQNLKIEQFPADLAGATSSPTRSRHWRCGCRDDQQDGNYARTVQCSTGSGVSKLSSWGIVATSMATAAESGQGTVIALKNPPVNSAASLVRPGSIFVAFLERR
ncbi:hypothetical protein B0H13DRAFT_1880116 [Mycena leptocephala]|nr:hypothetical protein B0H13DRAFT_1880116 [Mycena leptocephala]